MGSLGRNDESQFLRSTLNQGHIEGIQHPLGTYMGDHGPTDNAPTEGIQENGQVGT